MKSRLPWSIRGIDERTREAALAAARQSGLAVGDWLNQAIAERAAEEGVESTPGKAREFDEDDEDDAGAVAAAIEKLTRRLGAMDATSRAAISGLKGRLDEIEENLGRVAEKPDGGDRPSSLKGVSGMVDRLAREIDNADERARSMIEGLRARAAVAEPTRTATSERVEEAIRHLDQRIAAVADRSNSPPPPPRDSPGSLDDIRQRLNALLAGGPAPAPNAPPRAAAIDATLRALEARIDEAKSRLAQPRIAAPAPIFAGEDDQIGRIEARLTAIAGRLDRRQPATGRAAPPRPGSNLTAAIAEISAHQRALDEHAETIAMRRDQKALAEMMTTLRADIAGLTGKIAHLNRGGTEDQEALPALARRLDAIAAEQPLDRALLTTIRADLDALRAAADGGDRGRLDALAAEVSALRRQLEASDNPGALSRLEMRIGELAGSLDAMVNSRHGPAAAVERLESRLDEIATRIDGVLDKAPSATIVSMQERLATLVERLDGMAARQHEPVKALDDVKAEIAAIRRDIAGRSPQASADLEREIRALAARVETVSRPEASETVLSQLEAQVAHLSAEVERSLPRTVALAQVEENLARLQRHLADNREESIEAARAAARDAVRELSGLVGGSAAEAGLVRALREDLDNLRNAAGTSNQRTETTLGSVHDLLAKVVDRLSRIEDEAAGAAANARPTTTTIPRADLTATAGDNRPLEPGSGRPDLAALRELAASSAATPERKATDRRAHFIAAARRAAQAAAAEAATLSQRNEGTEPGEPRQSAFARIGQAIRNRRRPLLLAAAAIVLAIGALQIFGGRISDNGEGETLIAAVEPEISEAAPGFRDIVPAAGVVPAAPRVKDAGLVAPSPKGADGIAFAAPEAFDNRFGGAAAAPDSESFSAVDEGTAWDEPVEVAPATDVLPEPAALIPGIDFEKLVAAAAAGEPAAALAVAARYAEGSGVPQNIAKAAEWYERAAEGGIAVAQYRLGSLYERGKGVKKDLIAAANWYQRAADQGNIGAMHNLAVLMSEGADGEPDHAKALQWFLEAGNYGVKDSQYNLGVIFARGLGQPQDLVESYKWFAIAAAQGDNDAAARRDEIAETLAPDELADAEAAVQAWRVKPPLAEANGASAPEGGRDAETDEVGEADRQALVKKIQALLAEQGYDPGPPDGFEGPKTREAIISFQRTLGVAETGRIDGTLIAAIEGGAG